MDDKILKIVLENPSHVYFAVFGFLFLCGLGLPLPEDITLLAGGYAVYLAAQNGMQEPTLIPMTIVGLVGVLTGDVLLFLLGRWKGDWVRRVWPFRRLLTTERMEKITLFFNKYGAWTAFFARFAPGVRSPTFLVAGSAQMSFYTFFFADGFAALISVPLWVWLAWRFGAQIDRVKHWLATSRYGIMIALVVFGAYVGIRVYRHKQKKKREHSNMARPVEESPMESG